MYVYLGDIPAGVTFPFFFPAYDSTGASVTISGLAVTDIEIYKGTSMTQRSSDNGFALIDTDGIDLDSTTGIHGFSVDFSDNSDSGFYAAGSFYNLVVNAITIDSQTVRFIFAFRLCAAEGTAGYPSVDVRNLTVASSTTLATGTHNPQTGDSYAIVNHGTYGNAQIKTQAAAIETDTQDIQSRLPAALTGDGNIKADAIKLDGETPAQTSGKLWVLDDSGDPISGGSGTSIGGRVLRAAHLGDVAEDTTVNFVFNTVGADGEPITLAGTPVISVYKGNNTTERAGAEITLTVNLDSRTGAHGVSIDLSGDAFYATGQDYTVAITTGTVDGTSADGAVVGSFSIENRFAEVDVTKLGGVAQSLTDLKDFADEGYDPSTNKVQGVVLTDTVTTYTGNTPQTGDAYAVVNSGTHGNAALKTLIDAIATAIGALNDLSIAEVEQACEDALSDYDAADGGDVSSILSAIAGLNDLSAAEVNAEVVDALATDTYAEPSGTPGATISLAAKINWLFMVLRNPVTVTASAKTFHDDAGNPEWKKALSDDGTTYTEAEASAP